MYCVIAIAHEANLLILKQIVQEPGSASARARPCALRVVAEAMDSNKASQTEMVSLIHQQSIIIEVVGARLDFLVDAANVLADDSEEEEDESGETTKPSLLFLVVSSLLPPSLLSLLCCCDAAPSSSASSSREAASSVSSMAKVYASLACGI